MSNTYTQIYIHFVIAVKFRQALIDPTWKEELNKYIAGIIKNKGHKLISVNSMPDHLHLFCGMLPDKSFSEFMKVLKQETTKWINAKGFTHEKFSWQEGYGAFSYARSQVKTVGDYIDNQKKHHATQPFISEYKKLLECFEVEYDEKYIFKLPI